MASVMPEPVTCIPTEHHRSLVCTKLYCGGVYVYDLLKIRSW